MTLQNVYGHKEFWAGPDQASDAPPSPPRVRHVGATGSRVGGRQNRAGGVWGPGAGWWAGWWAGSGRRESAPCTPQPTIQQPIQSARHAFFPRNRLQGPRTPRTDYPAPSKKTEEMSNFGFHVLRRHIFAKEMTGTAIQESTLSAKRTFLPANRRTVRCSPQ